MGIVIGIGIGVPLTLLFVVIGGISQGTPTIVDIPGLDFDDPRFAQLDAFYDESDDKTTVVMYLTNNDGNYVKANGNAKITLCYELIHEDRFIDCFSNEFKFEKDGFYTWRDSSGLKRTAHQFVIYQELRGGFSWDASADITTENGLSWVDVDTTFAALES